MSFNEYEQEGIAEVSKFDCECLSVYISIKERVKRRELFLCMCMKEKAK